MKIKGLRWGRGGAGSHSRAQVSTFLTTSVNTFSRVEDPGLRRDSKLFKNTCSPTLRFLKCPKLEKVKTDSSPKKMWSAHCEALAEGSWVVNGHVVRKPQGTHLLKTVQKGAARL